MDPRKPLRRLRSRRMIAGVVAGLSDYIGIDPVLGRVLYIAISAISAVFLGIIVYILLWIVIPEE